MENHSLATTENNIKEARESAGNFKTETPSLYSWSTFNDKSTEKIKDFDKIYARYPLNNRDGEKEITGANNFKLNTAGGNNLVASVIIVILITVIIT